MSDRTGPDQALVERLQAVLRQEPSVRLAVLFGSAAAGARRPDSDLDVAILPVAPGLDPEEEAALCHRLTLAGGADVDLIRLDGAVSTLLRWQIATTGVLLVETVPGAFARFRAESASEYIEFAPALAYHGEIFRRRLIEQGRAIEEGLEQSKVSRLLGHDEVKMRFLE